MTGVVWIIFGLGLCYWAYKNKGRLVKIFGFTLGGGFVLSGVGLYLPQKPPSQPKPVTARIAAKGSLRVVVQPGDARVVVESTDLSPKYYKKVTGSNKFGNLTEGTYSITISKPNYLTQNDSIRLLGNMSREFKLITEAQLRAQKKAAEAKQRAEERAAAAEKKRVEQLQKCSAVELVVEGWNWTVGYGYATVQGRVTNVSGVSLDRVVAKASFYTADGDFISGDEALVDYQPVLSNQTSPFKVMETANPAMKSASLEFADLFGSQVYRAMTRKEWNSTCK